LIAVAIVAVVDTVFGVATVGTVACAVADTSQASGES
jgi:hypothetical protein